VTWTTAEEEPTAVCVAAVVTIRLGAKLPATLSVRFTKSFAQFKRPSSFPRLLLLLPTRRTTISDKSLWLFVEENNIGVFAALLLDDDVRYRNAAKLEFVLLTVGPKLEQKLRRQTMNKDIVKICLRGGE
jgi:hypothetical protein